MFIRLSLAMSNRDIRYGFVLLLCIFWFLVLNLSNCEWVDSPFGFVRGCNNYGISWNKFMAPTGMFVVLALPISFLYFILRAPEVLKNIFLTIYKLSLIHI